MCGREGKKFAYTFRCLSFCCLTSQSLRILKIHVAATVKITLEICSAWEQNASLVETDFKN